MTAIVLTTGCGTIVTQQAAHSARSDRCHGICGNVPNVYSGTVQSARYVVLPHFADACGVTGEGGLGFMAFWMVLVPFFALDVPLSVAADTVLLPYTAVRQIASGDVCP